MSTTPIQQGPATDRHPDQLISVPDFLAWVGVSRRTFEQWCQDGTAPRRIKIGRHIRIRWSDALAWVESKYVPP